MMVVPSSCGKVRSDGDQDGRTLFKIKIKIVAEIKIKCGVAIRRSNPVISLSSQEGCDRSQGL